MQGFLVLRMPSLMSDSAVRLGLGMRRTREPSAKLSPRYYAIEKRNKRNGVIYINELSSMIMFPVNELINYKRYSSLLLSSLCVSFYFCSVELLDQTKPGPQ